MTCSLNAKMQKGFPTDISQVDLEAFWNGVSDKVKSVRIRRYVKDNEKIQKPSCFVELADEAERDRVVALELMYNEAPIQLETRYAAAVTPCQLLAFTRRRCFFHVYTGMQALEMRVSHSLA
jgi:hypothetical protein